MFYMIIYNIYFGF